MKQKRYVLLVSIFLLVLLIAFAGISGMSSPKQSKRTTKETTVSSERRKNIGYEEQDTNPLTRDQEKKVTEAVNQYYIERAEQENYIDYYKNVEVYMKDGPEMGTYIVFAKYYIKIKGIYTEVPGLNTFYAVEEKNHKWKITEKIATDEEKEAVQKVSEHEDIKSLLEQTEKEYEEAVASDAILREALTDLENACGDVS